MIPRYLTFADVQLRPFCEHDARDVYNYWRSDSGWEKFNASVPTDALLRDASAFVTEMSCRDPKIQPNWALLCNERVVGVVSLSFEQENRIAVVGYGIHADQRGQGLVASALGCVLSQAFMCYPQLQKIRAHTDTRNAASIRVLEKLGFSHEGLLRQNQFVKGSLVDESIFGLLRDEWRGEHWRGE